MTAKALIGHGVQHRPWCVTVNIACVHICAVLQQVPDDRAAAPTAYGGAEWWFNIMVPKRLLRRFRVIMQGCKYASDGVLAECHKQWWWCLHYLGRRWAPAAVAAARCGSRRCRRRSGCLLCIERLHRAPGPCGECHDPDCECNVILQSATPALTIPA